MSLQVEKEYGGLDILVSNAATNPSVSMVLDTPEEVWDKIFDVNVKSTYLLMQESLPLLKKSKSSSIIIVSSISAYTPFSVSNFFNCIIQQHYYIYYSLVTRSICC